MEHTGARIMNTVTTSSAAKVRRMLFVIALVVCPLLTSGLSNAQTVTASLFQTGTGLTTFSILPNQTFQLTLQVTTNFISSGVTYFFNNPQFAGSPFFQITARDMSMNPYPDPTTDDATAFGGNAGLLNPFNDFDLGSTNNGSATDPAGTYTIGILTFHAMNVFPPGPFTIATDRGIITDRTGGQFNDVPFSAFVTINFIPEPTTVGLAVIGGAGLLVAAWRKRSRS
jgi:hypothetical protein